MLSVLNSFIGIHEIVSNLKKIISNNLITYSYGFEASLVNQNQ